MKYYRIFFLHGDTFDIRADSAIEGPVAYAFKPKVR